MSKPMGHKPEYSTRKAVTPRIGRGGNVTIRQHDAAESIPRSMPQRRQGPEHD